MANEVASKSFSGQFEIANPPATAIEARGSFPQGNGSFQEAAGNTGFNPERERELPQFNPLPAQATEGVGKGSPTTPRTRAEINRDNASKSTGPRTAEGKQKSKFNARRHNLTGQTILGSHGDLVNYFAGSVRLKADFEPSGEFETVLVQSLADAQWQLDRARTMETNILFDAASKHTNELDPSRNFEQDWATGQAKAFLEKAKDLDLISRYATRYHRQVLQLHDRLWRIQKERKKQEQEANLSRHSGGVGSDQAAANAQPTSINQSDKGSPGFVSQTQNEPAVSPNRDRRERPNSPETASESIKNGEKQAA